METTVQTDEKSEDTKVSNTADEIIAIAKKVQNESPEHFEQVFQAIIHLLYPAIS